MTSWKVQKKGGATHVHVLYSAYDPWMSCMAVGLE